MNCRRAVLLIFSALALTFFLMGCGTPTDAPTAKQVFASRTGSLNLTEIPKDLQAQLERYPELKEFVANYPDEHTKHHNADISGDYTPGEIPLFLQWDPRWGYEQYGDNMMALTGCGPTCLSMVAVGLTGNTSWNPLAVANFADKNGYYCNGSGSYWTLISQGSFSLGLSAAELPLEESTIRQQLEQGNPIICSMGSGDFTTQGHFLVLVGENEDGTIEIHDPNSRKNSETSWELTRLMSQMQNLWAMSAL